MVLQCLHSSLLGPRQLTCIHSGPFVMTGKKVMVQSAEGSGAAEGSGEGSGADRKHERGGKVKGEEAGERGE